MGNQTTYRSFEAAQRRQQREAQRRCRELERQSKEQSKLSAAEQARLEVETFEKQLEALLSVHKEQSEPWDWVALAAALPPPPPQKHTYHEQKVNQRITILATAQKRDSQCLLEQARLHDEQIFQDAMLKYNKQIAEWEQLMSMARRILAGERNAYIEALNEFKPFDDISDIGSAIYVTVHSAKLLDCVLKVNGRRAIPGEVKTLTSSGKVSVKPMAKGRFHEIYQDFVSGCLLRVAREMFALFPIDTILLVATVDWIDSITGKTVEQPVLSVVMPRAVVVKLDFDRLDPSDTIELFQRRGDFKASRKLESFQAIVPLTPAEIAQASIKNPSIIDMFARVQNMRSEIQSILAQLDRRDSKPL